MKLVDYSLDLNYISEETIVRIMKETGCSRNEASSQEYEKNWKWKRREFENQTRCICSFFSRLLGPVNTKGCWKILVECVPAIRGKSIKDLLGVYAVQVQFDYDSFISLDDLGKKKMTLETLMKAIRAVAADKNWDMKPFEIVYTKILEERYKNEWMWKKPVKSPDKKAVAHVFLQHEVKQIDIFIIICDKNGREIVREKIITELPNEWNYVQHLGEIKWLDNNKVVLVNMDNDKEWLVSF